jgi:AcrR family transcriptional regulator
MAEDDRAKAEIERLWGSKEAVKPGPKGGHTVRSIASAAIRLADNVGLDAVSMRSLASEIGVSAMGLYTYFPGKQDLIEVMIDEAYRQLPLSFEGCNGWRERISRVAHDNWNLILQHPWLAQVEGHRPVLGPNVIAKYDFELGAIDGMGLDDVTLDLVLSTVHSFVRGAARDQLDKLRVAERTGQLDADWWRARAPRLAEVLQGRFPLAQRVGAAAGFHHDAPTNPDAVFAFGLERLLDGIDFVLDPTARRTD